MSRANDVGGQTGFGPVPVGDDGDAAGFDADWEARVWVLQRVLRRRDLFNGDEFRDAIERIPAAEYLEASYFERWLLALELMLDEKGIA